MIRIYAFLAGLFLAAAAQAQESHVHDFIDLLPAATEAKIERALAEVQKSRNQRIDVVLVQYRGDIYAGGAHFDAIDPATDALEPTRKPDGSPNDNVMLVVSPGDTNVLIAIGNGFSKGYFPLGDDIIGRTIIPEFRKGDLPGGIVAGVNEIVARLRLDVPPK